MVRKQIFSLIGLLAIASSTCPAMQQQQQQVQKQDQKQNHDHNHNNDQDKGTEAPAQDDTLTDLNSLLQTVIDKVNTTYGSVDNMIKQKNEDHPRICPTCGDLASRCPADRERIRNGNIMKCGCDRCGGRQY